MSERYHRHIDVSMYADIQVAVENYENIDYVWVKVDDYGENGGCLLTTDQAQELIKHLQGAIDNVKR